jgi:RND family efflux transporter MFP subunit
MPDSPLITLVDLSKMQLEALVPVADVPSIKVGQSARFKVDGFGAREFTGEVERINPQTQAGTRSITIYVTVANTDGALRGGMFAEGDLVLQHTVPVLAVPNAAVRQDNNGAYVLSVQNDVITRAPVVAGTVFPDTGLTVIEKGLMDSDRVIVAPASTLKPGTQVKFAAAL